MSDKVEVEINKRRLSVEMEGLTPIEIHTLARQVDETMTDIFRQNEKMADSSKLAILVALTLAAEKAKLQEAADTERRVADKKIEEMSAALRSALGAVHPKS